MEKGKNGLSSASKDWRQLLFVLKRTSDVPMLYYYRDTKKRWQKQTPKGVIVLSPWFRVSIAHECAYKFSFVIKHPEGIIYLAAKDNDSMNSWLVNIQAQLTLNTKEGDDCYEVEAIPSDDMNKLQAKGNLILKLSSDEIKLAQACTLNMVATWPLNSLRWYSSENGVFTIEMGRRSPRGLGLYSFKTVQDSELFDKVQFLIKKAATESQNTLYSKDGLRDPIDSRPPAPLPLINHPPPPLPPKDNALDDIDSGGIRLNYCSVIKSQLQPQQMLSVKPQDMETVSPYDLTEHKMDAKMEDINPDVGDHLYDVLQHDKGQLVAPKKPDLSAYNTVHIKENNNNASVPQDASTYDVAFPNSNADSQQPVSNPVYSLGGLSNNPMYGTSADVEEVRQSLENLAEPLNNTSTSVNGQQEFNEIENSDEMPPPVPPQNF